MQEIATLYAEELKATMRGRYAWLGAAAILLAIGGIATVGTQDTWLDGYGIIAYGLVPLGFLPLAAGMIASPRANRFVESVFTTPVERGDWLTAKILVLLTLAAAYYFALTPMLLVYIHYVGLPFLLGRYLIWTAGTLVASIAIGTLIGVLFIGRSIAAPAGTGMGVLLVYVGLVPLQELMVARGHGASQSGHVALLSPAVLLKNALGFALATGSIPATTEMTWISFTIVVMGALALAVWVFLRAQGVETWETTRTQRWGIALAIAGLILLPALLADTDYNNPAPAPNHAPALRIFGRAVGSLALVPSGGKIPARCCSPILNRDAASLGTNEETRRDMLVLLPAEVTEPIADPQVRLAGENGLELTAGTPQLLEKHVYSDDTGPLADDGHHIHSGWILRIPVMLMPTNPWDVGGNRYPLSVSVNYQIPPDTRTRSFTARAAVEAEIPSGIYEMGAASSIFPLACLGAALLRWRHTR